MLTTIGIVEVDSFGATKEQGPLYSLASRRLGHHSVLEWVVRRVSDCQQLAQVIVVAAHRDPRRRSISELAPSNVPVYYGRQADALARAAAVTRKYKAEAVVRISLDHPFVDPALIDQLISFADSHRECEYVGFGNFSGRQLIVSRVGLFAEWCRADALLRADRDATDVRDRADFTRYVYGHPDLFQLQLLPVPTQLDRNDLRLTVVSEEDWEHAQEIYDAIGPESLDWQRIARLLKHQPAMRERMALLNRAEAV